MVRSLEYFPAHYDMLSCSSSTASPCVEASGVIVLIQQLLFRVAATTGYKGRGCGRVAVS